MNWREERNRQKEKQKQEKILMYSRFEEKRRKKDGNTETDGKREGTEWDLEGAREKLTETEQRNERNTRRKERQKQREERNTETDGKREWFLERCS